MSSDTQHLEKINKKKALISEWLDQYDNTNMLDCVVMTVMHNLIGSLCNTIYALAQHDVKKVSGANIMQMTVMILRKEIMNMENSINSDDGVMQ
jgi:hypothetical protein